MERASDVLRYPRKVRSRAIEQLAGSHDMEDKDRRLSIECCDGGLKLPLPKIDYPHVTFHGLTHDADATDDCRSVIQKPRLAAYILAHGGTPPFSRIVNLVTICMQAAIPCKEMRFHTYQDGPGKLHVEQ